MKKFKLLFTLTLISAIGLAQSVDVTGTVSSNGEPLDNVDVYIMTINEAVEPIDTLGTIVSDENGNFTVTINQGDDPVLLVASSSACPQILIGFVALNGEAFVEVECGSSPLSIQNEEYTIDLSTYPNPTDGNAFVNFYSEKSEAAQIRLLDMSGKLVLQENVSIRSGQNQLDLDLDQLTEGVYILFFDSETNQRGVTKVVIQ